MKLFICTKCGAGDYYEQDDYRICSYCRSKYIIEKEDLFPRDSSIAIDDDIMQLLQKCHTDPANARRYASLILDIDPSNNEAKKFLIG